MKIVFYVLALWALVVSPSHGIDDGLIPDGQVKTAQQLIETALDSDLAFTIVESLTTEVGPRLAGSEAEARARKWGAELGAVLDANVDWFLKSVTGLQRIMIAGKPMFPAMRRAVGKLGYSRTERHEITRSCAKVATLLFMMDSFEDDDEAEGQAA